MDAKVLCIERLLLFVLLLKMLGANANEKALCDLLFVGNSNVCPICHHLREIRNQNVLDIDLDI